MTNDNVVDAEIVDDDKPAPGPFLAADTVLAPCHHGCTCGLHQQTVYGDRVPPHDPTDLDHGEMGLLVEAVGDTTRMLNGFHDHFRKLRRTAIETHGRGRRALRDLATSLNSDAVQRACAERDGVEQAYANLAPDERQPPPHWLKATAVIAVLGMVVFDAYFFQQIFLDILQVSLNDPWWKRDLGLVAAVVMAIGLIAAGRILAGPVWRMRRRWRQPGGPDEPPPRRAVRMARVAAIGAVPTVTFFILGWWASFRGQTAVQDQLNAQFNTHDAVIPTSFGVMLLLLSLAITVVVLEILVYNPYLAQLKRSERAVARVRRGITASFDSAARAVEAHEIAWSDLRSARDEVISFAHSELARPWQQVILPARLRHGRAGPKSIEAQYGAKIEIVPAETSASGPVNVEQVRISYQLFEGMAQPQPGPGPLAEVIRIVLELDPKTLSNELSRLERQLHAQFGSSQEDPDDSGRDDDPAGGDEEEWQ